MDFLDIYVHYQRLTNIQGERIPDTDEWFHQWRIEASQLPKNLGMHC